jgi:hypothetical protein
MHSKSALHGVQSADDAHGTSFIAALHHCWFHSPFKRISGCEKEKSAFFHVTVLHSRQIHL